MIVYGLICRGRDASVLADFMAMDLRGNAANAMVTLMEHLRDHPNHMENNQRVTFIQQNDVEMDFITSYLDSFSKKFSIGNPCGDDLGVDVFYVHVLKKENVYYGCISDDPNPQDQKVSYAFLDALYEAFTKKFRRGRIQTIQAYGCNKSFQHQIRSMMYHHNINHDTIAQEKRVTEMHAKIEQMKEALGRNITIMIETGEDMGKLVDKSEEVEHKTVIFKKRAKVLKQRQRRNLWWTYSCSFCICLVLFFTLISISLCGFGLKYCRHRQIIDYGLGQGDDAVMMDDDNN